MDKYRKTWQKVRARKSNWASEEEAAARFPLCAWLHNYPLLWKLRITSQCCKQMLTTAKETQSTNFCHTLLLLTNITETYIVSAVETDSITIIWCLV